MANTLPDIRLSKTAYVDIYTLTGIPKGTSLLIQNKNTNAVYVQVRETQPAAASLDGFLLVQNQFCYVTSVGSSSVWASGSGLILVQAID